MSTVRLNDEDRRIVVTEQTTTPVLQVVDRSPRVVVESTGVKIISVGIQGPPGALPTVPGQPGDVLFSAQGNLAVDSGEFYYSQQNRSLVVRNLSGTVMDGGNF